jgi:Rieske 2Fe-2S family protein
VVAHVDYVRAVSLRPLGPTRTKLRIDWLFPAETLAAPGFDLMNTVNFAKTVLLQDGAACEMNQRGLASEKFAQGTLMPQEFDVFRFQQWVRKQLDAYAGEVPILFVVASPDQAIELAFEPAREVDGRRCSCMSCISRSG